MRRAVAEGRLLLTRDVEIGEEWWIEGLAMPASDEPLEPLREVGARFGRDDAATFTRCTRCNAPLEPVTAAEAGDAVPPAVRAADLPLARCPARGRVYWEGSHTRRMRETLGRVIR